ncbi:MAG: hypothetical protein ACSLE3_05680 [Microbacteriaceae bacterium]
MFFTLSLCDAATAAAGTGVVTMPESGEDTANVEISDPLARSSRDANSADG